MDGDSATLAQAVAILSDLARLPARQDLAITGSINARGEVLTVGSVSLKAVGWWRTCVDQGLCGTQGLVLPAANAPDLQLPEAMLRDVRAGRFHVYTVEHLEELLPLMLGRPTGRRADGKFAGDSVFGRAMRRLDRMAHRLHPARREPPKKPEDAAPDKGPQGN